MSKSDFDTLESLEWGMKHFGGLITNRVTRRRDVLRLVARGWAKSLGAVTVCDGDGFHVEPEREQEGFALTEEGVRVLAKARRDLLPSGYPASTVR